MPIKELCEGLMEGAVLDMLYGTRASRIGARKFLFSGEGCKFWCDLAEMDYEELKEKISLYEAKYRSSGD
jgi:hypothetical protein